MAALTGWDFHELGVAVTVIVVAALVVAIVAAVGVLRSRKKKK